MKKENQVRREIPTSKLDIDNESNIANNNIDNTWKTVQVNRGNNVDNKDNNKRLNSIDVRNKSQPIFIHENEVIEPLINNRMNNVVNEYKNAHDITKGIINIGRYCKEHNFNSVTISSSIYRSQKHLQLKLNAVNTMLMYRCKNYGLGYIDNSDIKVDFLEQDGLHLNKRSKSFLANNFINFINRYYL